MVMVYEHTLLQTADLFCNCKADEMVQRDSIFMRQVSGNITHGRGETKWKGKVPFLIDIHGYIL
jgi:hypothetical protein